MRLLTQLLLVATSVLIAASAKADIGDQLFKLLTDDGAEGDTFGWSVAINGSTAIVGAYRNDDNGNDSGSAYLFDTATGQQIAKLLPEDGAADDNFGWSVAISGTTAIVGSVGDDDNGNASGSAYLFDITTGQQLAKLLPSDGASDAWFGYFVAISDTTAIVGAYLDDANGSDSGAAYLFDTTTGQQTAKLLPNDGAPVDFFGFSVAISGNTAIVGSVQDDDNGGASGSAYLFDITTGQQLFKLLPNDGTTNQGFGYSVSIHGTLAVIGAWGDDGNGADSGAAYLFDTTTGQQIEKLVPNDGAANHNFGWSVAINGTTCVVGSRGDDYNGSFSGSAYLFDTTTGQQIAKLIDEEGAALDFFGHSVAISDTTAIVGVLGDDDNGSSSGSAFLFSAEADTDGDGLLDSWEANGLDINGDGTVDLDLPAMGADPMHKDLFLEVDIMANVPFSPNAMQTVIDAFWAAPIDNPDNDSGINLHIDWQNADMIGFVETWGDDFLEFDVAKGFFFGTASERDDPNWEHIHAAKKRVFRYCIFANRMLDGAMGIAEYPGNDFYITLGGIDDLEERVIASTFMHEFGHNLNLGHGGLDDVNNKPNYVSVMNYNFDLLKYTNNAPLVIDFSREVLLPLNEANVDETIGIQSTVYSNVLMFHGFRNPGEPPKMGWMQLDLASYDWNRNGQMEQGVPIDLNWFDPDDDPSPGEPMNGCNDWDLIVLPLGTEGDYADLVHNTVEYPELDEETFHWMRENVPPSPAGAADLVSVIAATGTLLNGDFTNLQQSDQSFVQTRSGFGQTFIDLHHMELIVGATTNVTTPTSLSVLIESRIDQPAGIAEIRLRNWTTGQFDRIGQYPLSDFDSTDWFDGINAANYVEANGEIELSIKHIVFVPFLAFTFESFIDHVQITVE